MLKIEIIGYFAVELKMEQLDSRRSCKAGITKSLVPFFKCLGMNLLGRPKTK